MMTSFVHEFDTPLFKGKVNFPTGVYIDGKFSDGASQTTIDVIDPTNGKVITSVSEATSADVDRAVSAAQKAFDTVWGLNAPGSYRGKLMHRLAELMDEKKEELAALEALDVGKTFKWAMDADLNIAIETIRYFAGWADKIQGKVIETTTDKLAYTRHEPIGVVGQIVAWNFPLLLLSWKIGPALACGNTIVFKPSEFTPLTTLRVASLITEAGFPPGVVNILTGRGPTVGEAMSSHMKIEKLAFTGSTLVGRKVMENAAKSNLKDVTLELGGKSPNIIFDDADLELAVGWSAHGIFWNHGQACCAGTRIFVQAGIYDEFLKMLTAKAKSIKLGDPFAEDSQQGPQVSKQQFDRVMSYIDSGKSQGATVHTGGARYGEEGYWIEPTIFVDTKPGMKIVQEEIFGPVGVVIKFEDEEDVLRQANDTMYGLAAAVFTKDVSKALSIAHKIRAGTVWVNHVNQVHAQIPFGGFKQSGIGRDCGEYAIQHYTAVKAVQINIGNVRI
ncbi:aldehyde dehydrogenase [Stereum hirsutum FP-91666 SS1]|uniref:aldehyde dehydrogenase n=1 Tax=Stereum hirsutum (strain FP-91666) TaxID=721885 RepID=UPI000440F1CD|nr:aldehyde dehydrogenase [Stereum hirsutum FP-91666 SS1]EIM91726.1 aldehyde dehydrogenase [Stereum hirsutum FP-91666 SS1]